MTKLEEYLKEAKELEERKLALEQKVADGELRKELINEANKHLEEAKSIYEVLQLRVHLKKNTTDEVVGYAFGDIDLGKPNSPNGKRTKPVGGKGGGRTLSADITQKLIKALTENPDGLNQSELAKNTETSPITVGKHIQSNPDKFVSVPKGKRFIIKLKVQS
jgi:NADPH-dependent glutamate synthase beta subunit-like oxidoreductase